MNQSKVFKGFIISISLLSILAGLYSAFKGDSFQDYFFSIMIGVILAGSMYFQDSTTVDEKQNSPLTDC